ncbi:hypothetical protein OIE43_23075 [Streptomyces pseudovenezuelae]|uniref:hypothetical protein n=1 Tax=Streptomyces pseudovenezuelae TaxID=67350 RepID=UPI002E31C743|nr:hypothetical protein [Streptomyces pseudovenezuelae]
MSESENQQVGQVGPVELTVSGEPVAAAPAGKPVRRGRVAAVVGSVVLAVAVVAGVGYTVITVDGADRDAGAPVWKFPKGGAGKEQAAAPKGLSAMLVPYGADGWSRGPDIGEYGYDARLSGAQATALRKKPFSRLPRSQRKAVEKQIDKQRITGMAMRSYLSTEELSSVYTDKASTVTVELSQLDNKAAARGIAEAGKELLAALGDAGREGPRVEGHKDARCVLMPTDDDEKLDAMFCAARQGNVLVSLIAESAKPMQQTGIAMLLREQLDRIAEPGESV